MLSDVLTQQAGTVIAAVFTAVVSVQTLFIKWLVDKFEKVSRDISDSNHKTQVWLIDHEEKDQGRHEDNLYRFEKIAVALARLGSDNGTH